MKERDDLMTVKSLEITQEALNEYINACLLDDAYVKAFFDGSPETVQIFLRIIMNKPDLIVKTVEVQHVMSGIDGAHSVRFDVYAVDSENRQYDIEFQVKAEGANPYRAVYNASMLTLHSLKVNENYYALAERERVVIFITATDVLKGGLPLYTIERRVNQTGKRFNDGTYIIYVNASHKDSTTELGRLLHDIRSRTTEDMLIKELAERSKEVRKEEEGVKLWDKMRKDTAEAATEAATEAAYEGVAVKLIKTGKLALNEIASACNLTLQRVQELAAGLNPGN